MIEAWAFFGIKLWPGAGKRCWDRKVGGFPVDYPELMPLDRTIHHRWKNANREVFTHCGIHEENHDEMSEAFSTTSRILGNPFRQKPEYI